MKIFKYMEKKSKKPSWNEIIHRPQLPEGWSVIEQQTSLKCSTTNFIRWGKTHHNGQSERIWVVLVEHNPEYYSTPFVVRGGLHAKGPSGLNYFHDIKSATECLVTIMEATDRWIEEINSDKFIKSYNDKIEIQVKAQEKRRKDSAELYA